MKKLIIIALFFLHAAVTRAQSEDCIAQLKEANNQFEQGDFDEAIRLLNATIGQCNLDNSDKIEAYKLLILSFISVDDLESADKRAADILKTDPNYKPDKFRDDRNLVLLFKKFATIPSFSVGISCGGNEPIEHTIHQYSVTYPNGEAPAKYKSVPGYEIGLFAEKRIYRDFWLQLGAQYRSSGYKHTLYHVDSTTINYFEKLTYFDLPVAIKYNLGHRARLTDYLLAGATLSFLTGALSTTSQQDLKDIVSRTGLRSRFAIGIMGGYGLNYRVGRFNLFAEGRYNYYPQNVNKAGTRYNDEINLYKYYYVDDDFRLDNVQVLLGLNVNILYSRLLKKPSKFHAI